MKSDTLKIYLLLLANCHFRQGKSEINITYVDNRLKWKEAAEHCLNHGGVLENNETVIENQPKIMMKDVAVWIGKYKSWTPWFAVFGCYEVPSGETFKIGHLGFFHCQKLCANADYFSIKNDQCVCIPDIHSLTKIKDYKPCNCCNCFQIMKRCQDECICLTSENIDVVKDDKTISSETVWCMAAQCAGKVYKLTREKCETNYAVRCDNGMIIDVYKSHMDAVISCEKSGSFIKWYPESICANNDSRKVYLKQHWTSAKQSIDIFEIIVQDDNKTVNPTTCYKRRTKKKPHKYVNCSQSNTFFCRFDTANEDRSWTSFPSCKSHSDNNSSNGVNSGAIAGSVVAVLILIIVILAGLFLFKRRKDNKLPDMRNSQENSKLSTRNQQTTSIREKSVHDYHEINLNQSQDESQSAYSQISDDQFNNEPSKSRYSFARPIINGKCTPANVNTIGQYTNGDSDTSEIRQQRIIKAYPSSEDTTGDHYDKTNISQLCNDRSKAEIIGRQNPNFEINEKEGEHLQYLKSCAGNQVQNTNYSLAKPVRESGEIDPYSDNQDYDKLNNVKKRDATNTQCKVYDHLPTTEEADPTYDHSVINSPKVHDNNYDHFTFDDDNI